MTQAVDYLEQLQAFRAQRALALTAENSWLALAGLFWLEAGESSIGAGPDCTIRLPRGPEYLGRLHIEDNRLELFTQIPVEVEGQATTHALLHSDHGSSPSRVNLEGLSFVVIRRGSFYAVRLWDNHSPARQHFAGLEWFDINPAYRVQARFVAQPRTLEIGLGAEFEIVENNPSPGYVVFELEGQEYSLVAESANLEKSLFFNFKDPTNGTLTYGAGRFLITEGVQEGWVTLDFNRVTNPYCAYTRYAVCPLPPLENRLPVAILAGEKNFQLD